MYKKTLPTASESIMLTSIIVSGGMLVKLILSLIYVRVLQKSEGLIIRA